MLDKNDMDATNDVGNTPLHVASSCGFNNICKVLIDAGCARDLKNASGLTPMEVATGTAARAFE